MALAVLVGVLGLSWSSVVAKPPAKAPDGSYASPGTKIKFNLAVVHGKVVQVNWLDIPCVDTITGTSVSITQDKVSKAALLAPGKFKLTQKVPKSALDVGGLSNGGTLSLNGMFKVKIIRHGSLRLRKGLFSVHAKYKLVDPLVGTCSEDRQFLAGGPARPIRH